jgi:hypothetical protein
VFPAFNVLAVNLTYAVSKVLAFLTAVIAPDLTALKYTVMLIPDAGVFAKFIVKIVPATLALVTSRTSPTLMLAGEAVAEESDTMIRSLI